MLSITDGEWLPDEAKEMYDNKTKLLFFRTKKTVNELMMLNQEQMYHQSEIIQERSRRAMMPAFVSIVAAALFALLFYYFIRLYFIRPVSISLRASVTIIPKEGDWMRGS